MEGNLSKKLDLDLIQMVQKARMLHDASAKPSQIKAVYWIEAKCDACQGPTPRSGQWVLKVPAENIDEQWATIKAATESGKLGYKSKVSTASQNQHNEHWLCVRTCDSQDEADVQRIRAMLTELKVEGDWSYETDQSAAGKGSANPNILPSP